MTCGIGLQRSGTRHATLVTARPPSELPASRRGLCTSSGISATPCGDVGGETFGTSRQSPSPSGSTPAPWRSCANRDGTSHISGSQLNNRIHD